jgi:choline dehydrogenase-like flavoprotein
MLLSTLTAISLLLYVNACFSSHSHGQLLEFDYVIVGGGTAGLTVANCLSADTSRRVAVIEAGDSVFDNPNVLNVTQFGLNLNTSIDWQYTSTPQRYANRRTFTYPAGKRLLVALARSMV